MFVGMTEFDISWSFDEIPKNVMCLGSKWVNGSKLNPDQGFAFLEEKHNGGKAFWRKSFFRVKAFHSKIIS
jgi:hypothetical protein